MNDNNNNNMYPYIVKCTRENFDDVKCMVQVFGQVVDVDDANYCITTFTLDSIMKKRLADAGASFWQESRYTTVKTSTGRR